MKQLLCLGVILCTAYDGFAQKTDSLFVVGEQKRYYSTILEEDRTYWLHLPADYNQNDEMLYPVIYLLDGEKNFLPLVGIRNFLDRGKRSPFPQAIIIGICNTDRTRDLTPTKAESIRGGATMENSGAGEKFISFLQKEFIPHIEDKFRSNKRKVLIGHSFGGLTAIYTLIHHTNLFTDYLVLDASFWWDDQKLLKQSAGLLSSQKFDGVRLFLARAGSKDKEKLPDENARELQLNFRDKLKKSSPDGLKWKYRNFENETHGSVFLIGSYYGLKYLFSRYQLHD